MWVNLNARFSSTKLSGCMVAIIKPSMAKCKVVINT